MHENMPRGPRLDIEGALHHVMVRGIEGRKIFLSDIDREDLTERLGAVWPKTETSIYAWSLMPNHFHLLARTGRVPLSTMIRKVLTGYALSFNHRHNREGHLFQNRYKSILVEEEPYLLELVRYIHLNPIRKELVKSVKQLDTYPWSGHAVLMGNKVHLWQDTDHILTRFSNTVGKSRQAYREFIITGIAKGKRTDLTGGGLIRSAGGWKQAKIILRGREKWAYDERILGSSEFVQGILREVQKPKLKEHHLMQDPEKSLEALINTVASLFKLNTAEVTSGSRRRCVVEARKVISFVAIRKRGMSLARVSARMNVSKQSIIRGMEGGEKVLDEDGWVVSDLIS